MSSIANEQCANLAENLNVFDDLVEPQTKRSRRKFATENSHVDLAIRKEISAEDLGGLADCDLNYARWLRVTLLRLLVRTPVIGSLKGASTFQLGEVIEFLGFENFDEFTRHNSLTNIRRQLNQILTDW